MTKAKLVKPTKIDLEKGYIYFVDDNGNIVRTKETDSPGKRIKIQVVNRIGIVKEPGYAYFVDTNGDVRKANLEKIELKEKVISTGSSAKSIVKKKNKN